MTALLTDPEAAARMGRPKKSPDDPKRNDAVAKIDADLLEKAKIVCTMRKTTIAAYLSGIIEPVVNRDFAEAVKLINEKAKPRR